MSTPGLGRRLGLLWTSAVCAILLAVAPTAHARAFRAEIDVGYLDQEGPVPPTLACLGPQEVFGATVTVHAAAAAEPTIAVNPTDANRIVAAWQEGRIDNGGALDAGIGYSRDGGRTWRRTTVPFQACLGGPAQRASDVWLSYAADGRRLYLTALLVNATIDPATASQSGVVVTTSDDDGATWSPPRFVAESPTYLNEPTGRRPFDDKNSVTADPNDARKAYVVWDRLPEAAGTRSTTRISRTLDGGQTWSAPHTVYDPFPDLRDTGRSNGIENDASTIDNIVVVQPRRQGTNDPEASLRLNGDLLNFMVRIYASPTAADDDYANDSFPFRHALFDLALVRSRDHGASWETTATVVAPFVPAPVFTGGYTYDGNTVTGGLGTLLRTGDRTPSVNINPENGFLYVAHQSNLFRSDQLPEVSLWTSRDGGRTWSGPARVSRTPLEARNPQAFNPFVAVSANGRVGILYFDFRHDDPADREHTRTDAWLAIYREVDDARGGSTGVGLDFVKEVRLSRTSFIAQHGPTTGQGVMTTGDYPFLAAHADRFYAIYTKPLRGPTTAPTLVLSDPDQDAAVVLDESTRQAPFVSIVGAE